jgi:hypothetical protein
MSGLPTIDPLAVDLRAVDVESAISSLRKYLEIIETQMEQVFRAERTAHGAGAPTGDDDYERDVHRQVGQDLELRYTEELIPAMRYSFVVLVHIVFESELRKFCSSMGKERNSALSLSDISGKSPIERSCTYLTKVLGLPVGNLAEWQHLRSVQKVRDCIVHAYGHVNESRDKRDIERISDQNCGLGVGYSGRMTLTRQFCEDYVSSVEKLFYRLFFAVGWYTIKAPEERRVS